MPHPDEPAPTDDALLAASLASRAGAVLVGLRAEVDAGQLDAAALGPAGDAAAEAYLEAELTRGRPDDAILSEEAEDDPRRLAADRVWIVDPLDGTREFAERGDDGRWRDDFSVHVALWRRGIGLIAGAVALPARDRVEGSAEPVTVGASSAEEVLTGRRPLRIAVSRSRAPKFLGRLQPNEAQLVPIGSSGAKALAVLDGTVDAYVHAGGQHEWDTAAPVAVAMASGLVATRLDGTPLVYNQVDPWCPDLLICHPLLAVKLRSMLDALEPRPGSSP